MLVALSPRILMYRSLGLACLLILNVGAATAQEPSRAPKVWAVLVGIDAYEDPELPACSGAAMDARALRKWLVETAKWETSQVLLMDGSSQRNHGPKEQQLESLRPTRANLDWAVKEWLAHRVKPGDVIQIYFAGQAVGAREGDPQSRDQLLPIDARSRSLDTSGWPIQEVIEGIASRGENPILLWLDTSLAGRGHPAGDALGRRTTSRPFLQELTRWPGVSAWMAADGRPSTEPTGPNERGAFLSAVLPAMGTAERPGNILGSLFAASRDERLVNQGFRTAGGLGPEWSLWPRSLASIVRPPSELLLQHGHSDRITAIVFSPDGSTMITASRDSTIKVWRLRDRVLLRTLTAHFVGVTALAQSPDGARLVSADGAGRVVLWDLASLQTTRFLGPPPHVRGIAKVVFRGDGSGFATLDDDGRVVSWSIGEKTLTPKVLAENATALAGGDQLFAVSLRVKEGEPALRLFDGDGKTRDLPGVAGFIPAESLSIRSNRLGVGNKSGRFVLYSLSDGTTLGSVAGSDPIEGIAFSRSNAFALSGTSLLALSLVDGQTSPPLLAPRRIASVKATEDERLVAVADVTGQLLAWDRSDPKNPLSVEIEKKTPAEPSTVLAVSPEGQLISGDKDGGIRFWDWPGGRFLARVSPHRGKIETLAVSPDGRVVAQIDHDRRARLFDLMDGRGLVSIPGQWKALAFLPDGQALAMTRHDGSIAIVDRGTNTARTVSFLRPLREGAEKSAWGFGPVAVSPDGKYLAAGSPQGPLACVWPITGGQPVVTIRDHDDPISSVRFSSDSRHIVSASLDGTVKIRELLSDQPLWTLQPEVEAKSAEDPGVIAVALAPGPIKRAATGHLDGHVWLWDLEPGRAKGTKIGRFDGPVKSVIITPDGTRLVACGVDKTIRQWRIDGAIPPGEPRRFLPQHTEQVNDLAVWPDGRLIASVSDDSTLRFWKPDGSGLIGTICMSPQDGNWVAFTPEGRFDSAPGGETQVAYAEGNRVVNLDQSDDDSRVFGLAGKWLGREPIPGRSPLLVSRPPPLFLEQGKAEKGGDVEMKVRVAEADLVNFRLFVNDKPVRDETDFQSTADPAVKVVSVQLAKGENRIVAMASRPVAGAIHGRSNEVLLVGRKDEKDQPGVVHALALGVSKYRENALKFADRDASDFAHFLSTHGIAGGGRTGMRLVLQNNEVTPLSVEKALTTLRELARPEDTIVVFLAGHTDVRRERYYLLLPGFPFSQDAQRKVASMPIRDDPATLVPYTTIYRSLSRMNALNRLVVVDACQADAIDDDPGVRRIQDKVDDGAHRARTAYLLSTRRGEAAESTTLEHGLVTHLLLRGMGSTDLKPEPGGVLGNADADGNGVVTTEELRQFLDVHLPILTTQVDLSAQRANPASPPREIGQKARAQGATSTFPLVKLPK